MTDKSDDQMKASIDTVTKSVDQVITVPISELYSFHNHPFKVNRDEALSELAASIKEFGVVTPALVRPRKEGGFEIISGHRRKAACALADVYEMPVIVRELDDDTAIIAMTDSNMQRENLLPSEKAFAHKMRLDAIKRQAGRPAKDNSRQVVGNFESADIVGKDSGESGRQVQRYIRLTNLITPLLEMVDNRRIAFNPGVELSYLAGKEQNDLLEVIRSEDCTPSLSQAIHLKKHSQEGGLNIETISSIVGEVKANQSPKLTIRYSSVQKYYPASATPQEIETDLLKLLEERHKRRERGKLQER
jgi:ParB family transcriptional regulator, chromosome partitioning protein